MKNPVVYYDRDEWHQKDGKCHRADGPAVITLSGTREYWIHGQLHRDDGPAVVRRSGSKEYYQHGELHRTDGPAVILVHSNKVKYYIHGRELTEWELEIYSFIENI